MRQRRILFVVEGDKAEPKLLRSIFRAYDIDSQREVVSYRTNVHVLLNELNKCAGSISRRTRTVDAHHNRIVWSRILVRT